MIADKLGYNLLKPSEALSETVPVTSVIIAINKYK